MFEFLNLKKQSTWILIFVFSLIFFIVIDSYSRKNKERFTFVPWNMGTRFYPSYDIRGYPYSYNQMLLQSNGKSHPLLFPWNYPYPGLPYLFWSPYFYEANGKYTYDKEHAKALQKVLFRPLKT
jgi:hypothetical protein